MKQYDLCVETRVKFSRISAGNFRIYALHKRGLGVAGRMRARDGREGLLAVRRGFQYFDMCGVEDNIMWNG